MSRQKKTIAYSSRPGLGFLPGREPSESLAEVSPRAMRLVPATVRRHHGENSMIEQYRMPVASSSARLVMNPPSSGSPFRIW